MMADTLQPGSNSEDDDISDRRFVEVTRLVVEDERQESKVRVVVKHRSGAEEAFESHRRASGASIPCQTFIETIDKTTSVSVSRIERSHKSRNSSFVTLDLDSEGKGKDEIMLPASQGLKLAFKLGRRMTATEVADSRLKQALGALATKKRMMDCIESGTANLKLFISLGTSVAELNEIAKVVASAVGELFGRIEDIPKTYSSLRDVVLELAEELSLMQEEKKQFDTRLVRRELDRFIELTIKSALEISTCYSRSKFTVLAREIWSADKDRVEELGQELKRHKERIQRAFLTEVKKVVSNIDLNVQGVDRKVDDISTQSSRIEAQKARANEEKLLSKLLPPDESLYGGKPQCLAGTRLSVLAIIEHWFDDCNTPSRLFWLYGVAGCGKSSVAASICYRAGRRLAGSFFCKRDQDERRNPVRLIWTLGFYLAKTNPCYREKLVSALREPDVFVNKNIETQFKLLLQEPLESMSHCEGPAQLIFVVDALDECEQNGVVARLVARVVELAPWIRFIVTSRDAADIRSGIEVLSDIHQSYDLFTDNAREDIRAYVLHEFGPDGRLSDIAPFLKPSAMNTLVTNSQGLFIWIRTVIEYIVGTEIGKLEVIERILRADTHAEAETSLDALYRTVLVSAAGTSDTGKTLVRLILGYILAASSIAPLTEDILYAFLPPTMLVVRGEYDTVFKKLSAILILDNGMIKVFHASLLDFIGTKSRCGEIFYEEMSVLQSLMATGCLEIMMNGTRNRKRHPAASNGLRFNICKLPTSYFSNSEIKDIGMRIRENIPPELNYCCSHWISFYKCALHERDHAPSLEYFGVPQQTLSSMVEDLVCSVKALYWLEVMSLTRKLNDARSSLLGASPPRDIPLPVRLRAIAFDLTTHLDRQFDIIRDNVPHAYLSGLNWIPSTSPFWTSFFFNARVLNRTLDEHSPLLRRFAVQGSVRIFAVSPDASSIATGSYEGMLFVWDMGSGLLMHSARIYEKVSELDRGPVVISLSYSRSGHQIASSSSSSPLIHIWDSKTLRQGHEPLQGHTDIINCLAYSPKDNILASGSRDSTVRLWCSSTYTELRVLSRHSGAVNAISFSPDGAYLASGSNDCTLNMWNVQNGRCEGQTSGQSRTIATVPFSEHSKKITTVAFSCDGTHVASGSSDTSVCIWDAKTLKLSCGPLSHFDAISGVAWTPAGSDGMCLVTATRQASVQTWEWSSGIQNMRYASPSALSCIAGGLAFSSDGTRLITSKANTLDVYLWDLAALKRQDPSHSASAGGNKAVKRLQYTQDGSSILTARYNGSLNVWTTSGTMFLTVHVPRGFSFLAFSPDGRIFAAVSETNILIQPLRTGATKKVLPLFSRGSIVCSAFSPDSSRLVMGSSEGTLRIWNVAKSHPIGRVQKVHTKPIGILTFSQNGKLIACSSEDGLIALCNSETGEIIGNPCSDSGRIITSLAFSPKGDLLASGSWDRSVRIRDTNYLELSKPVLEGHKGLIYSISFSSDGRYIYSASKDQTIRCWDVHSGAQVGRSLTVDTGFLYCIATSPDGFQLAGGLDDGSVKLWDTESFFWEPDTSLCAEGLLGPERIPASIGLDGWLRTKEGRLLFWIPSEHRSAVLDLSTMHLPWYDAGRPIRIKWDQLRHGESWTSIYSEHQALPQ